MQFLTPYMRHKSNRTSNFHKKPHYISSTTSRPLTSPAITRPLTSPATTTDLTSPTTTFCNSHATTISSKFTEPFSSFTISEPLTFHSNKENSVLKSATEIYRNKDTVRCSTIKSPIQNIDPIVSEIPCLATESQESDTILLSSDSSYVETLPASSNDENMSNINKNLNKIKSNIKNKRKVPAADGFYMRKKKTLTLTLLLCRRHLNLCNKHFVLYQNP